MNTTRLSSLTGRRPGGRRWWAAPVVAALAVVASACQTEVDAGDRPKPVTLVVSEAWMQSHQADGEGAARIGTLQKALNRLRKETRTGWVGRQDDVTGYLGDLSGGSWPGGPGDFMDSYGPDLFGVDSSVLRFEAPDTQTVPGVVTTRANQAVGAVPVLDATLVVSGRGTAATTDSERVTGVRGRVFPGLTVDTTPTIPAEQASATAAATAGGTADGTPALVVLPTGAGVLAWEVVVVGATVREAGRYYVDAHTGELADVRPVSVEVAPPVPSLATPSLARQRLARQRAAAPDPNSVELTGNDALGRPLTAYGLQAGGEIELTDTTTQSWDQTNRTGAVQTFDASKARTDSELPGRLITSPTATIGDPDTIAAQSYSHAIMEYWASLGRNSWDGKGGRLVSSVHYGPPEYCNAFFNGYLRIPQMVYANPCVRDGKAQTGTYVEPDIAAHEITHGVTQTTARLLYTGQSGALNESFSDYFGNVIGNLIHGSDSVALGEDSCSPMTTETIFCHPNPDGSRSFRYMLNGTDFDDYLRVLNPGERLRLLLKYRQDAGGVHYNSAIWNNALWSIRTRLAQIDGQSGNTSPLARSFDRAVYGALTRLTPTSGFVDARNAVEQVVIDSQLDPVVLRTAREVFDAAKICPGCPTPTELAGDSITTATQTQLHPTVSGNRVTWLDLSGDSEFMGHAAATEIGSNQAPVLTGGANMLEIVVAGKAVLLLDLTGKVVRIDDSGSAVLDKVSIDPTQAAGFSGSDAGAAWLSLGQTVKHVDPAGTVTQTDLKPLLGDDTISTIAAGGGSVAIGTTKGKLFLWHPGSGDPQQVGQLDYQVVTAATNGDAVFAVDAKQRSVLITGDGRLLEVTHAAAPFGATMSDEYVVFAEAIAPLQTPVAPGGKSVYPDTDLLVLSLATGKIYDLHPNPAQQGFPSLSGNRLVWQDATYGGDDIFTTVLPEGL